MATRTWTGAAADIAQTSTVTFALTWAAADSVTVTINGKDWVVTMGTGVVDAATAATTFKEAWNGETATYAYTVNFDVADAGEFDELTATVSSAVVTLTADTAGKPVTLSQGDVDIGTTAGNGTATLDAELIAATGKNHWDNADNWSGDTVPVNNDDVVFEDGTVSCLYGLDTGIDPNTIVIKQNYTGTIGLPRTNADNENLPYSEYRDTYLKFTDDSGYCDSLKIGDGDGAGSSRIKIDLNDLQLTSTTVRNSGRSTGVMPAILLKGGTIANDIYLLKGYLGIAYYTDETATIGNLYISYINNIQTDASFIIGAAWQTSAGKEIIQTGGTSEIKTVSATATGTVELYDGVMNWKDGAITTCTVINGTLNHTATDTITTLNLYSPGTVNFGQSLESVIVSNCNVYGDRYRLLDQKRGAKITP
jgi:hypothetical protein